MDFFDTLIIIFDPLKSADAILGVHNEISVVDIFERSLRAGACLVIGACGAASGLRRLVSAKKFSRRKECQSGIWYGETLDQLTCKRCDCSIAEEVRFNEFLESFAFTFVGEAEKDRVVILFPVGNLLEKPMASGFIEDEVASLKCTQWASVAGRVSCFVVAEIRDDAMRCIRCDLTRGDKAVVGLEIVPECSV